MSISYRAMRRALRTRLLTLQVCTTGATSLAATAAGFTRSSGSFIDDGFERGLELTATGFGQATNNGTAIVTRVQEQTLDAVGFTVSYDAEGGLVVTTRSLLTEAESAGRTLTVGLPTLRAWENVEFDPPPGYPWVLETLLGGSTRRAGANPQGSVDAFPQLSVMVHTDRGVGAYAADAYADALLGHFPSGKGLVLPSGDVLRVRGRPGPFRNGSLFTPRQYPGFVTLDVEIPCELDTLQPIS